MAHAQTIQLFRTATAGLAPTANTLAQGELALEMASTPPILWAGVPTSVNASGQVKLTSGPGPFLPLTGGVLTGALYTPLASAIGSSIFMGGSTAATSIAALTSSSPPSSFFVSAGSYSDGVNWKASSTAQVTFSFTAGSGYSWYSDTGLTVGQTLPGSGAPGTSILSLTEKGQLRSPLTGDSPLCLGALNPSAALGSIGVTTNAGINYLQLGAGQIRSGGNWLATSTSAFLESIATNGLTWYANASLTAGNTFTPTAVAQLDPSGAFYTSINNGTGIFVGSLVKNSAYGAISAPTAGYLDMSGGSYDNAGAWTATASSAEIITLGGSQVGFWVNTGLTAGNTYGPTQVSNINSGGTYTVVSDIRVKAKIKPEKRGLRVIRKLHPISFIRGRRREVGFSAQDVQAALPEAVSIMDHDRPGGTLGLAYAAITPVMVNGLQELDKRVAALEAKGRKTK